MESSFTDIEQIEQPGRTTRPRASAVYAAADDGEVAGAPEHETEASALEPLRRRTWADAAAVRAR